MPSHSLQPHIKNQIACMAHCRLQKRRGRVSSRPPRRSPQRPPTDNPHHTPHPPSISTETPIPTPTPKPQKNGSPPTKPHRKTYCSGLIPTPSIDPNLPNKQNKI